MQGRDGRNLIVVQGKVDDPANLWVHIDKKLAAAQPVQISTSQIDSMRLKQELGFSVPEKELGAVISR
jgi:RNA binding exosome subunit